NSPPPPGILPDMTETQHPVPYRLHGNPQQNQSKIIQTVENIAPSGAVPQSVAYPDRKKRHGRSSQHGYVFPQMFSAVLIPFLYNSGHGNRIENICFKPYSQCNVPSSPELRRISRAERLTEILRKPDSEKLAASDN